MSEVVDIFIVLILIIIIILVVLFFIRRSRDDGYPSGSFCNSVAQCKNGLSCVAARCVAQ